MCKCVSGVCVEFVDRWCFDLEAERRGSLGIIYF